ASYPTREGSRRRSPRSFVGLVLHRYVRSRRSMVRPTNRETTNATYLRPRTTPASRARAPFPSFDRRTEASREHRITRGVGVRERPRQQGGAAKVAERRHALS